MNRSTDAPPEPVCARDGRVGGARSRSHRKHYLDLVLVVSLRPRGLPRGHPRALVPGQSPRTRETRNRHAHEHTDIPPRPSLHRPPTLRGIASRGNLVGRAGWCGRQPRSGRSRRGIGGGPRASPLFAPGVHREIRAPRRRRRSCAPPSAPPPARRARARPPRRAAAA